jgi:hypothetical protein
MEPIHTDEGVPRETTPEPQPAADADFRSTAVHLFANRDRRRLLLYLVDGNPEKFDDIPEHIRAADHIDEGERHLLVEMLVEEHLPLLEENGIIEWDRERNVILRGERFDEIRPLLTLISENRDRLPDEWL